MATAERWPKVTLKAFPEIGPPVDLCFMLGGGHGDSCVLKIEGADERYEIVLSDLAILGAATREAQDLINADRAIYKKESLPLSIVRHMR